MGMFVSRVDGEVCDVTEVPELSKSKQHNIDKWLTVLSSRRASVVVSLIPLRLPFVLQKVMSLSTLWTTLSCCFLSIMPVQFVALLFQS